MRFLISVLAVALVGSCGVAKTTVRDDRAAAGGTTVPDNRIANADSAGRENRVAAARTTVPRHRVAAAGTDLRGNQVAAARMAIPEKRVAVAGPILFGGWPQPFPGAVFGIGTEDPRYLAPGARRWETLFSNRRHNVDRVGYGGSPVRVVAAWHAESAMRQFILGSRGHREIALPNGPTSDYRNFTVGKIEVAPSGRDALVFMNRFGSLHVAFRVALDGRFAPRLIIPATRGSLLHASSRGAVIVVPGPPSRRSCGRRGCLHPGARIIAYDISGRGVREKTLLRDGQVAFRGTRVAFRSARAPRGGDGANAVVELTVVHPPYLPHRPGRAILRYRYGDAGPSYNEIAPYAVGGLRPVRWSTMSLARNAFLYLKEQPHGLDLWIQPLAPGEPDRKVVLPPRHNYPTYPYGMGARPDRSVWVHWGDHLIVVDPSNNARSVNLEAVRAGGAEWAGVDIYTAEPESLWIGVEASKGKGRFYARVAFSEVDRKAVPWPATAAAPPNCARLPDLATLRKWQVHRATPCHGGAPNPRARPHKPYDVVKQLPDGTRIVDGRERGCIRVRDMGCFTKCLPPDTLIATPGGEVPIEALGLGMSVWTRDRAGNRVPATIIRTTSEPVPAAHEMVSIRLADRRSLLASPGHPDADGHGLEMLARGQVYDGSPVVDAALVGYGGSRTFDILPSGDTGIYWANGIAIGSTLWRRPDVQARAEGAAAE